MPVDLADSLNADEVDRKSDHATLVAPTEDEEVATLTATIETNLQEDNLETRVGSLSGEEASSEWEEEHPKSRAEFPQSTRRSSAYLMRRVFYGVRQRWTWPQSHGNAVFFFLLNVVETQKSQRNVGGADRRETGLFFQKQRHQHLKPWSL